MATKKKARVSQHPLGDAQEGWTYHYEIKVGSRVVPIGTPLKIENRRGDFIFLRHAIRDDGLEVILTRDSAGAFRSFYPTQIKRIAPKRRGRQ